MVYHPAVGPMKTDDVPGLRLPGCSRVGSALLFVEAGDLGRPGPAACRLSGHEDCPHVTGPLSQRHSSTGREHAAVDTKELGRREDERRLLRRERPPGGGVRSTVGDHRPAVRPRDPVSRLVVEGGEGSLDDVGVVPRWRGRGRRIFLAEHHVPSVMRARKLSRPAESGRVAIDAHAL